MKVKKYVGVEVYGLIVQDVHVFDTWTEATIWFKQYTGHPYPKNANGWDKLYAKANFEEDYDQTKIFAVDVNVPGPKARVSYGVGKRQNRFGQSPVSGIGTAI